MKQKRVISREIVMAREIGLDSKLVVAADDQQGLAPEIKKWLTVTKYSVLLLHGISQRFLVLTP